MQPNQITLCHFRGGWGSSASNALRLLLLVVVPVWPTLVNASQVVWFSRAASVHVDHSGTSLDDSYVFELGAFNIGFTPSISNTAEWAANWHPADRSSYQTDTQTFGGTYLNQTNEAVFQTSNRGYIWGYSAANPTQWILIGDSSWKWPDTSDPLAFPLQWNVSSANSVIAGQVDPSESNGYFLKTSTVNQSSLPVITAEAWQLSHFNSGQLGEPALSGWQSDPDEDGLTNLIEFALDSRPLIADRNGLPTAEPVTVDGQTFLQLTFKKSPSAPLDYLVEVSFDQRNWNSGEFFTELVLDTPTRLTVRSSVAIHLLDRQFMRLVVGLQP